MLCTLKRGTNAMKREMPETERVRVRVVAISSLSATALEAAIEGAGRYEADLVDSGSKESEGR